MTAHRRCLERIYSLSLMGSVQAAVEVALDFVESRLSDGEFVVVDDFMRDIDASRADSSALLAVASITVHCRDRLVERLGFIGRAEARMNDLFGTDRTAALLRYRR